MSTGRLKLGVLVMIFVFCISIIYVQSFANNDSSSIITTGDGFVFNTDNGTITGYSGDSRNIVIPGEIDGIIVSAIGSSAFQGKNLTSAAIPGSITSIGENAFSDCTDLTSITIPTSVSEIHGGAFDGCTVLSAINVDAENANYSSMDGVLFDKFHTTLIRYPEGNTSSTYEIPYAVTCIGSRAFQGCTNLTEVIIPNSVESISEGAFINCSNIENLTIPEGVTSLGAVAFMGCDFGSLTIPNTLTDFFQLDDLRSFSECRIETLILEDGIQAIYPNEFTFCYFESIVIPNSVTSIGDSAFYGCTFTDITIPDSVTRIDSSAFSDCINLKSITIPYGVTSIARYTFYNCQSLENISIPDSVVTIGINAFRSCTSLESINIPAGVTSIDSTPYPQFMCCTNLTAINVDAANGNYSSINGVLFNKNQSTLLRCPEGIPAASYNIPGSVTRIADYAFRDSCNLEDITIPEGVANIGKGAFIACPRLVSVRIPTSVASIGENAFNYCAGDLTFFTFPDTYADGYARSNSIRVEYINPVP